MNTKGKNISIQANGITILYDDLGEGPVPIIFLHGFPFDKSTFQSQMEFLQETNRVIAYDIRGFGGSGSDYEKASISLYADDLIHFMDALEIKKAMVCGFSMGGYILLNAVNRYPERFASLVLCDTQCIADSSEAKERRIKLIREIESTGLDSFAADFTTSIFFQRTRIEKPHLIEEYKKKIRSNDVSSITEGLTALTQRYEMCSWLRKITVPTLILCGKEDRVTPPIQSEFMHNKIANSQLYMIPNAGHMANIEQPEEFNERLINFVLQYNPPPEAVRISSPKTSSYVRKY